MKRITFICGHYGSGKSEVATNIAIKKQVNMIFDLDIVNPYFRSRELEELFNEHKIKIISSTLKASTSSDLPFISHEIMQPFHNESLRAIYDLGGDGVGARMLRQFSDVINEEVDLLMVININRMETANTELILRMINSIESSSGVKVTGLINNTNLLRDTTVDDILKGEAIIKEVARIKNLDIKYTGVNKHINTNINFCGERLDLELYLRKSWL
jgi:hypothetical protein